MKTCSDCGLSDNHWTLGFYRQRMTIKEWRKILLSNGDTIIFKGTICKLKAENMGAGVVEVYKVFPLTIKNYIDADGNSCTLLQLIRKEPEWAENRIKQLSAELEAARKRIAELEAEIALCHQREGKQNWVEAK